jgi:hypothetical protein
VLNETEGCVLIVEGVILVQIVELKKAEIVKVQRDGAKRVAGEENH